MLSEGVMLHSDRRDCIAVTATIRKAYFVQKMKGISEYTERKNWVILTKKDESLAELKFEPGLREIGKYLSQIDSQIDNLTLNIESIWLKYSPITRNPVSNFSSVSDSTF